MASSGILPDLAPHASGKSSGGEEDIAAFCDEVGSGVFPRATGVRTDEDEGVVEKSSYVAIARGARISCGKHFPLSI
jgi:hypothetical protein